MEMEVKDLSHALRQAELAKDAAPIAKDMEIIDLKAESERLQHALRESERRTAAEAGAASRSAMELNDLKVANDRLLTAVRHTSSEYRGW
eukprot:2254595-Prymnesium_polylepis.1